MKLTEPTSRRNQINGFMKYPEKAQKFSKEHNFFVESLLKGTKPASQVALFGSFPKMGVHGEGR